MPSFKLLKNSPFFLKKSSQARRKRSNIFTFIFWGAKPIVFDAVWKRFITACDYFFEQKNKATSSQRSIEVENMEKKKALIEKLSSIDENMDIEEASTLVRDLMKEWNSIGHVPFKEKDKLYKQYHGLIDQLFDRFNISASNKKLSNFRSNINNIQGVNNKEEQALLFNEHKACFIFSVATFFTKRLFFCFYRFVYYFNLL